MNIFIVEDSAQLRRHLVMVLEQLKNVVIVGEAASEQDALAMIPVCSPDLVTLDLSLSPGSGFAVLRGLRAAGCQSEVLVLTSQSHPTYERLCMLLGANGFYDKSSGLERMLDKIKESLPC